jgi:hypothetical protein
MTARPRDRRLDDGTITMQLTAFQATEIEHGLDIDRSDGNPDWGELTYGRDRSGPALLLIRPGQGNLDAALYRITSSRDIPADNARDAMNSRAERLGYLNAARSLDSVVRRLVTVAGGREAFSEDIGRWI